jgi:hypothetical protein
MMGWIFGEWEQKTVFDYVEEFDEWDVTNVEPCFFPYLAFVYLLYRILSNQANHVNSELQTF